MDFQGIATLIGLSMSGGGLIATAIGLCFAGKQLRASNEQLLVSQRIARGDFLLHLDEMFRYHDKVHRRLRPRGEWGSKGGGPSPDDNEAWADIESYMGLFERIKVLVDNEIIDLDTVNRLYGYRITNLVMNDKVREGKLENPDTKEGWRDFIELARALKRYP